MFHVWDILLKYYEKWSSADDYKVYILSEPVIFIWKITKNNLERDECTGDNRYVVALLPYTSNALPSIWCEQSLAS